MLSVRAGLAICAWILLLGCGGDSLEGRERVALAQPDSVVRVNLELIIPREAAQGDTVPVTLRLRNPDTRPITIGLAGNPVAWDVVVSREDGTEVWRRLHGTMPTLALALVRIDPGGSVEYSGGWEQVDNAGHPVAPGRYVVQARIPAEDGDLVSEQDTLDITR